MLSYLVSCSDLICPILIHSWNEDLGYFGNNPYMKIDSNHFSDSICVVSAEQHVLRAFSGMYRHDYIGGGATLKYGGVF